MSYYISKRIKGDFEEVTKKVIEALQTEGFGVISEINMHEKLKEKIDIDFRKYRILGACNPVFAHKAMLTEDKIGTMLPCNIIIQEYAENDIEIASVDPVASMTAIENPLLEDFAFRVKEKLENVIRKVESV